MRDSAWFEPTTVQEAVALLREHGESAYPIAGGTDLLVKMNDGELSPAFLVDLSRISTLKGIEEQDVWVRLGSGTTFSELRKSSLIVGRYPILAQAATKIGGVQLQNLGTVGGNVCNAEPCADSAAACISLHAWVVVEGPEGERRFPIDEVFLSPGKTSLDRTDILTCILLPRWPQRSGGVYEKLSLRKAMDQSLVAVGASVGLEDEGSICQEVGIGMATVAPKPMRAAKAEYLLRGKELTPERIREAATAAAEEAQPRDSRKASAAYRREAIEVLTEKALAGAWEMARSK